MGYRSVLGYDAIKNLFLNYLEVDIFVKYATQFNQFIRMGTTINKFIYRNCVARYLPCVLYHIKQTDVWLLSPQTYHQICGGHPVVYGFQDEMFLPYHNILIPIENKKGNIPSVHNSQ